MATITIRNLSDEAHRQLKRLAMANNRSLEAEVRVGLEQRAVRAAALDRLAEVAIDPGPDYEGSVALIRSIRDEE